MSRGIPNQFINQKGFSLVEIMVALTVSLILMAGVGQLYVSSKQSYRFSESLSRLQENGRYAIEAMTKELRMIGYQGCADSRNIESNIIADTPPIVGTFLDSTIRAFEVTSSGWSPAINGDLQSTTSIENLAADNSDVAVVQRASADSLSLTGNMAAANANIQIANNALGFASGDIIVISDCESADIFRATNVSASASTVTIAHADTNNSSASLSKPYGTDARVMNFISNAYYVADTGRTNTQGNPVFALFRRDIGGTITELVEGVENMQLEFGEDLGGGNMRYVPANNATLDLAQVTAIRISLLVSSIERTMEEDDTRTYTLINLNVAPEGTVSAAAVYPNDRRLRRTFSSTIKIRNRG